MHFTVLTLFPEFFASPLKTSILGRAIGQHKVKVDVINIRDFATGKHKITDDAPYGGGRGMVMKPEPIIKAIKHIKKQDVQAWVTLLTPQGRLFNQGLAQELGQKRHLVLICGHYEGVDERVRYFIDDEISLGDFILTGGEPAALCIIDAVARLIPGVIGKAQSLEEESFQEGLLEYPQYTRPAAYAGHKVPEVLLSGHHKNIGKWRRRQMLLRTLILRPDLLIKASLDKEDREFLKSICKQIFHE